MATHKIKVEDLLGALARLDQFIATRRAAQFDGTWYALLLAGLMMPPIAQPLHAASATLPCEVSAGSMDESFFRAPEPFEFAGEAWSAKELPDGRLLVAMDGNYTTGGPDPVMRRRMVRLNDDGTIDPAFSLQAD